ncbi:MAG: homocysteine S-methyltransferase family protein [Clostridia bacterium]|nr:homocysteine S-methyltransferase family protein [Clostridia bacterium]
MNITQHLQEDLVIFDGAMGTMLHSRGLAVGEPTELWSVTHPDCVTDIHREYIKAGSRVVTSNTFGVNCLKYDGKEGRYDVKTLVRAGLECARRAADTAGQLCETCDSCSAACSHPKVFVALDIGPLGKLIDTEGGIGFEDAVSVFAETVRAGADLADFILIETMTDLCELRAAILAAKQNSSLPIVSTVVFDANSRMLSGADPATAVTLMQGLGVAALGINCSLGPAQMVKILPELMEYADIPVIVQPNAGLPRIENGTAVYDTTPDEFAAYMLKMVELGAHGIGGCCGTTPEYISKMCAAVSGVKPLPIKQHGRTLVCSRMRTVSIGERPYLVGERINPTGKPRIKAALKSGDYSTIIAEGLGEEDAGAHILDVNAGLPGIDEAAALVTIVSELGRLTPLPLQLDTSDPAAMEAALRAYCGIALINSVNGKQESLDAVLPLVQKYGGVVVGLTLDERGIPDSVEGRLEIAERIIAEAQKYGIPARNIVIDPLTLAVSSDKGAAQVTLDSVFALHQKGIHTILGVSNVSFGLPSRDTVNSAFFTMALRAGLSLAIMNPSSLEMQKAYHTYLALAGLDDGFRDYIDFAAALPSASSATAAPVVKTEQTATSGSALYRAIVRGVVADAAACTDKMLEQMSALDIINGHIIPALDEVGVGFEQNKIFLPQLLMSADAASAAFGHIKAAAKAADGAQGESKGKIILATVKGDIHDIGKNIVRMLLENYGYDVIDLGRDVSYETILNSTKENNVRLVGLSALMTTTVPAMRETVEVLHRECPGCRVMVGGAVLNEEYAREMGADHYSPDAMDAVRYAEKIFSDK